MGLYKRKYGKKQDPIWWVSYTDSSGKRVRRSSGTTERREAEGLEAKWKLDAFQEKQWDKEPERTFDELMLAYLKVTSKTKRSAPRDHFSAKHLYPFFSERDVSTFSPSDVRSYINFRQEAGVQPGTINRELGLWSAAINYGRSELEWDIPNPVQGRRLKEPEGRVRWLNHAEAVCLVKMSGKEIQASHLSDFIQLALNTGARSGEMLGLEWKRVDLSQELIHLAPENTKSGKRRSIPINEGARQALLSRANFRATHCPASQWVFSHQDGRRVQSVKRSFKTACRRAGIEDFHIHDLRHTCAAWLVSAGVPLPEVRDLLGHSSITMTERYAHLAPENVRSAVARLDGLSRFSHGEDLDKEKAVREAILTA